LSDQHPLNSLGDDREAARPWLVECNAALPDDEPGDEKQTATLGGWVWLYPGSPSRYGKR
jgi:hypothetical protein